MRRFIGNISCIYDGVTSRKFPRGIFSHHYCKKTNFACLLGRGRGSGIPKKCADRSVTAFMCL